MVWLCNGGIWMVITSTKLSVSRLSCWAPCGVLHPSIQARGRASPAASSPVSTPLPTWPAYLYLFIYSFRRFSGAVTYNQAQSLQIGTSPDLQTNRAITKNQWLAMQCACQHVKDGHTCSTASTWQRMAVSPRRLLTQFFAAQECVHARWMLSYLGKHPPLIKCTYLHLRNCAAVGTSISPEIPVATLPHRHAYGIRNLCHSRAYQRLAKRYVHAIAPTQLRLIGVQKSQPARAEPPDDSSIAVEALQSRSHDDAVTA